MCFVDGLRDDISSMVMIQHPSTLDSTYALTLVQEEASDSMQKKDYGHYEPSSNRLAHKFAYPLPPLLKLDKHVGNYVAEDHHHTEATRANTIDDKARALK
jgi:hypothetical protein